MLSVNQFAGVSKLKYLKNYMRYQVEFLHVVIHPLKLQKDYAILGYEPKYSQPIWLLDF